MTNRKPDISVLLPDDATVRARREALAAELRPDPPSSRKRVKARRLLVAAVALLAVSGGVAWAAGVFSADEIDLEAGVACADRPSLHANMTIFRGAADPVAKCERFWREGVVRTDDTTPPELTACTGASAGIAVFPAGPGVCDRLGLVPLPSDYAPLGVSRARAYAALFSLRGIPAARSTCASPSKQAAIARNRLSRNPRFKDVEVAIEGDEPCGGGYELEDDHIAVLTISRERAELNRFASARRLARGVAEERCLAPTEFINVARGKLAKAGLDDIEVRVAGSGECVSPGHNVNDEIVVVTFPALSHAAWSRLLAG